MLGRVYFEKAEDFVWSPEVQSVLQAYDLIFPDNGEITIGEKLSTGYAAATLSNLICDPLVESMLFFV